MSALLYEYTARLEHNFIVCVSVCSSPVCWSGQLQWPQWPPRSRPLSGTQWVIYQRGSSHLFSSLLVQGLINPWVHLHCFLSPVKSSALDSCSPKSQIVSEGFIIWTTYDTLHLSSDPWVEQDKNSLKWGKKRETWGRATILRIPVVTLLFWLSSVPSFL